MTDCVQPLLCGVGGGNEKGMLIAPPMPPKPATGPRVELQGLRAVAIIAVLLFHIWGSTFKTGYLGVDVFFIISGYLMCHLLSRKMPLNSAAILDFYFRRVKRIVPIYIFVIGITLLMAKQYVSRLDYQQLIDEAIPSLFFYSNSPSVHKTSYFDLHSKYFFFLHTWSLSVEMQFYLIVPLLFLIAQRLQRSALIFGFGALLFVLSFLRQFLAEGVAQHMPLDGRIWQFMSGFAAHFLFEGRYLRISTERWRSFADNYPKLAGYVANAPDTLTNLVLWSMLIFRVFKNQQLARLAVILCGAAFVALPNNVHSVLTTDALVHLGDVSYSVYLIHWPIFTLHRYIDQDMYAGAKDAPHIVGTYLILISVIAGYSIERVGVRLLREIKSWSSLILTIFFLYSAVALMLANIHSDSVNVDDYVIREMNGTDVIRQHTEMLWNSRNNPKPFSWEETFRLNSETAAYGRANRACDNRKKVLPTQFKKKIKPSYACNDKGTGTKNIVIVGNSHTYMSYLGIKHHFSDIADNLALFSRSGCVPTVLKHQITLFGKKGQKRCYRFINRTVEALKQWDYPVDIIISLWGYGHIKDEHPVKNWETDKPFKVLQKFYDGLNEVAREAVIISGVNLRFDRFQTRLVQERLLANQTIEDIGDSLENQLQKHTETRKRLDRVKCSKCVKVEWPAVWCKSRGGTFCRSVEKERAISYFLDDHHVTPYGSMFVGEEFRRVYEDFMKTKRNRIL